MLTDSSKNLCLFHILDGLRQGLSSFSGPSRAAVIFPEKNLELSGIISCGARTHSIHCQIWLSIWKL